MNGAEHFARAEYLVNNDGYAETVHTLAARIAEAQVHATLALAQATLVGMEAGGWDNPMKENDATTTTAGDRAVLAGQHDLASRLTVLEQEHLVLASRLADLDGLERLTDTGTSAAASQSDEVCLSVQATATDLSHEWEQVKHIECQGHRIYSRGPMGSYVRCARCGLVRESS